MLSSLSGLSALSVITGGSAPAAPPVSASHQAYYEASLGVLDGSDVAQKTTYGLVKTWQDRTANALHLVQSTAGNRPRWRSSTPVAVYNWIKNSSVFYLSQASAQINQRDASFFCLADSFQVNVRSITEYRTIFSLTGGAGELCINYPGTLSHGLLAWKDASGTYVSTSIKIPASLALYGVVLSASGVTIYCNDMSQTFSAIPAATTTGFSLFYGALTGNYHIGGINVAVLYNKALSAGEVAAVQDWAKLRKARFHSDLTVTKIAAMSGASRSMGYYCEDNLGHVRQASDGTELVYAASFGGYSCTDALTAARNILMGTAVDSTLKAHAFDPTRRNVVWIDTPIADVNNSVAYATTMTALQTLTSELRAWGWHVIWNPMAPWAGLDAPKEANRVAINAAIAALDSRAYGQVLAIPTELSDYTNTTYFDADQIHYTKAGDAAWKAAGQSYYDSYMAIPVTTKKVDIPFNGDYLDATEYQRDFLALGTGQSFASGLNGKQCLVTTTSGGAAGNIALRNFDTLPLTVMIWFKTSSSSTVWLATKYSAAGPSKIWYMYKHSGGSLRFGMSGLVADVNGGGSYGDDAWHCAAFVLDVTGAKLYASPDSNAANLSLLSSQAWSAGAVIPVTGTGLGALAVNSFGASQYAAGSFQSLRLWFEARSLAQLQAEVP